MNHFPIFIALRGRRIVLSGGGDAALAKLRLLLKTTARIVVHAPDPDPQIESWAAQGRVTLRRRAVAPGDLRGAALFYAADEDAALDARNAALARTEGVLVNIVDNLDDSDFITPAMVDRDPVTVAIGTEGTAPVLARALKADLEARLPAGLGQLARVAAPFRPQADALPAGRARRAFWQEFFDRAGPDAQAAGADPQAELPPLLARHLAARPRPGAVTLAVVSHPDADLLPQRTRTLLHEADLVLHDVDIGAGVLELARREADFATMPDSADPVLDAVKNGRQVVCLTRSAPPADLIAALRVSGLAAPVIPGLAPLPRYEPIKEPV